MKAFVFWTSAQNWQMAEKVQRCLWILHGTPGVVGDQYFQCQKNPLSPLDCSPYLCYMDDTLIPKMSLGDAWRDICFPDDTWMILWSKKYLWMLTLPYIWISMILESISVDVLMPACQVILGSSDSRGRGGRHWGRRKKRLIPQTSLH